MKNSTNHLPPSNPEIERALLRNLITVGSGAIDSLAGALRTPDLFYKPENHTLCEIIMKLYRANQTIDIFTVGEEAAKSDETLHEYVLNLITENTTAAVSQYTNTDYINLLQQKYVKRRSIQAFYQLQKQLFDPLAADYEAYEVLEKAYQQMSEIITGRRTANPMSEVMQKSIDKLMERIKIRASGKLPGINTGLYKLNTMLSGWQAGELYVIASRPGMGKTALTLHFAEHAARYRHPVLFFSLEMADYKLTDRLIIGETGLESRKYHQANLNNLDRDNIIRSAAYLSKLPVFFDEQSGIDIDYIVSASRVARRKHNIELIIIDYLQLIDMKERSGQTRDQAIGNVTRKLKQLSKELELPIILNSQLNRSLEARASKEPTLADLRESGNIEQDADVVLMLFRPSYYEMETYNNKSTQNKLYILTKKYRNGDRLDIEIEHNDTLTKFSDNG